MCWSNDIDEIYCTLPGTNNGKIVRLLNFAEKKMVRFYIVPEFYRDGKKSMVMEVMESIPLLTVRREPLQSAYNRFLKRTFDIFFLFGDFAHDLSDPVHRGRYNDQVKLTRPDFV